MFELEKWLPDIDREWLWAVKVFAVVLVTVFVNFFVKRFIVKLLSKAEKTSSNWDDIILQALSRPLAWVVWLIGLDLAAEIIYSETESQIFAASDIILEVGILLCITWFLLSLVRGAEQEFSGKPDQLDRHTAQAIGKLVRLAIIITAVLVILQTLGFSIAGVLAMGGVGGIAVGFAAKDLLANFFGGLVIYLDRPFLIGDWIRSPDREIEGTVEKIGWRVTMIRNFQSQPIYVPNSVFTNIIVENPSRMQHRRIYETIGLRYKDLTSMDRIVDEVKSMLLQHPEIATESTMMVNFNAFADSSVDFFVYTFTKTTSWAEFHKIKQDIMLKIADIVARHEAEIAFPTSTIHLADQLPLKNR